MPRPASSAEPGEVVHVDVADIAEVLGISLGSVAKSVSRSLARLADV